MKVHEFLMIFANGFFNRGRVAVGFIFSKCGYFIVIRCNVSQIPTGRFGARLKFTRTRQIYRRAVFDTEPEIFCITLSGDMHHYHASL